METHKIDEERRRLIAAAGAGVMLSTLGGTVLAGDTKTLRWGIIGTGGIANSMAPRIGEADYAGLAAVSSRSLSKAQAFAEKHGAQHAYGSWAELIASDEIDAVYVATPTSVREEICVAAAHAGKHVLGEKPFANLPSVQRIAAACRAADVGFMDGTHFPHHPRTAYIREHMSELVGWQWSVASAFQFGLTDKANIRMNPELEPYGAIGDAGWYNMRAAAEYLPADVGVKAVDSYIRRDSETNAVIAGSGVLILEDGSSSTWNCGFESGAGIMDLRITGATGVIKLDDFLGVRPADQPADFEYRQGWADARQIDVPSDKRGSTLMFEDFAAMVGDPAWREASIKSTERTQGLLDAIWTKGLENENRWG